MPLSSCPKLVLKLTYRLLPYKENQMPTNSLQTESLTLNSVESCYKLVDCLIRNHLTIPPSLRRIKNDFKVS